MVNYVFTLENFEYFLLILVRVTCFVYVAPLLGQQGIPNQIKIGFSFFVSLYALPPGASSKKAAVQPEPHSSF